MRGNTLALFNGTAFRLHYATADIAYATITLVVEGESFGMVAKEGG